MQPVGEEAAAEGVARPNSVDDGYTRHIEHDVGARCNHVHGVRAIGEQDDGAGTLLQCNGGLDHARSGEQVLEVVAADLDDVRAIDDGGQGGPEQVQPVDAGTAVRVDHDELIVTSSSDHGNQGISQRLHDQGKRARMNGLRLGVEMCKGHRGSDGRRRRPVEQESI